MIQGFSAVRPSFLQPPNVSWVAQWAPWVIAVGLLVLLAAAWWPGVPGVTAMAVVALGATAATVARFRGTPAMLPVLLLHLAVYGGLYALFISATLHAAAAADAGLGLPATIDLAASIGPAAAALGVLGVALRGNRSIE